MSRASARVSSIRLNLPMTNRLLDRQASLIDYLTSAAVLFGDEVNLRTDPALHGIDRGLLRLEARFCCNRRIKKIIGDFPRTFEILSTDKDPVLRAFIETNQQTNIGSLVSASQFYQFLLAYWRREPPKVPYLRDVAACEFSMVKVCNMDGDLEKSKIDQSDGAKPAIRRYRAAVPLRCDHDVRLIFERGFEEIALPKCESLLVVKLQAGAHNAQILEVSPIVFDLLIRLERWTDPETLGAFENLEEWVRRLVAQELVEVRA
jgi:hypothetical protein